MKILNIGSLNLDFVYTVDHIVIPGETEAAVSRNIFLGGKGLNQSCALAKAGAQVYHAGLIGPDGHPFLEACEEHGIHSQFIQTVDVPSGHTIIQIDKNGQNSILLFGGANQQLTSRYIDYVLSHFSAGDILLLQNEVNLLPYIVERAFQKNLLIALNPSPFNESLDAVDMNKIGIFILNEIEGCQLTGQSQPDAIISRLRAMFPQARVLLTLGSDGAVYADENCQIFQNAFNVNVVDTTAAGDTFTGYFLAGLAQGLPIEETLRISAKAASIAVTRPGAVTSIPYRWEIT